MRLTAMGADLDQLIWRVLTARASANTVTFGDGDADNLPMPLDAPVMMTWRPSQRIVATRGRGQCSAPMPQPGRVGGEFGDVNASASATLPGCGGRERWARSRRRRKPRRNSQLGGRVCTSTLARRRRARCSHKKLGSVPVAGAVRPAGDPACAVRLLSARSNETSAHPGRRRA